MLQDVMHHAESAVYLLWTWRQGYVQLMNVPASVLMSRVT